MAFTISCGTFTGEKRQLSKTFNSSVSVTGTLRAASSVVDPVILVDVNASTLARCSYMHISEFGRYYFITDVIAVSDQLAEVHGHCDVLKTYSSAIKDNEAILSRSSSPALQNRNLFDPLVKSRARKQVWVRSMGHFPKPSGTQTSGVASSLIMITTG